jgi:kynurenine formamidase
VASGEFVWTSLAEKSSLSVSRSPWGEQDEIGRLNWITAQSRAEALTGLNPGRVFDLSVEYFVGMPCYTAAGDPEFQLWMTHTPGGSVIDNLSGWGTAAHEAYSYCGDAFSMYTHCGTHIDTLNHVGHFGCFWNGWRPDVHLGSRTWTVGGPSVYPPLIARGVLIDIAGAHGVDCLPPSYAISAEEIKSIAGTQGTELKRGDVILIRTGRMSMWPDADRYLPNSPGIGLGAARYLCEDVGAMCIGADTVGLEVRPPEESGTALPVHAYMFATAGAQILEVVACEEIAASRLYEFAFLAFPLRLSGATGAPCRPVAIPYSDLVAT